MGCGSSTVSSESQAAEKPTGHPPSKQPTTDDSKTGSKSTNFGQTNEKLTSQETESKKPCEQDNILKTEENKQNTDEFKGTPLLRAPAAPPLPPTAAESDPKPASIQSNEVGSESKAGGEEGENREGKKEDEDEEEKKKKEEEHKKWVVEQKKELQVQADRALDMMKQIEAMLSKVPKDTIKR